MSEGNIPEIFIFNISFSNSYVLGLWPNDHLPVLHWLGCQTLNKSNCGKALKEAVKYIFKTSKQFLGRTVNEGSNL